MVSISRSTETEALDEKVEHHHYANNQIYDSKGDPPAQVPVYDKDSDRVCDSRVGHRLKQIHGVIDMKAEKTEYDCSERGVDLLANDSLLDLIK